MPYVPDPGYKSWAEEARRYATECLEKARSNPAHEALHDEHLARFYVLDHLHGRTFTNDAEAMRVALQRLRAEPPTPTHVFSQQRFVEHFNRVIDAVLRTIESPKEGDAPAE